MSLGRLLEKYYEKKISIKTIERHINRLTVGLSSAHPDVDVRTEKLLVSCVQRQIRHESCIEDYIDALSHFVKQAAERGSRLVVFPEYNFFDLFGLLPGFGLIDWYLNKKAARVNAQYKSSVIQDRSGDMQCKSTGHGTNDGKENPLFAAIFSSVAHPIEKGIQKIMSMLANKYSIYIYSGSYILCEDGKLFNAGSLFGPDGNCLGTQKKLHLTSFEAGMGMGRDCEMKLSSLPFGKLVFPICMDATYFETFRIARGLGADMVIVPIANMEEYELWKSLRGIWPRVQESYVYGLKASLNGWIAGMHFTGKAGIFAPLSTTPNRDGVMAISGHHEGDYLVTAEINIPLLHEARKCAEYHGDVNTDFEKEYVKRTYGVV